MNCSHCSKEISPAASFCPSCGVPVDKPSTALSQKPSAATTQKPKKHLFSGRLALIFGLSVVFFVALAYFFLFPRMNLLSSLKNSKNLLAETSDKTGKLNQSLQAVYSYVTVSSGENQSPAQDVSVLGENNSPRTNLYFLKEEIDEAVEGLKNPQVKAFSTPKNDPLKAYRDLRDLAVTAQSSAIEGLESAKLLEQFSEKTGSARRAVSSQLAAVTKDSKNYLLEGEKTARYYQTYTDAYVDLSGFIVASLQASNEAQVKENFEEATQIQKKMSELPKNSRPEEIEAFHQDILSEIEAAMNFLSVFNKVVSSKDPKAVNQVEEAAKKWVAEEQALLLQMQTNQLNFWKKNPSFANYDFLKTKQNEVVQTLEVETKEQSLFVLK